jgi:uncharacterized protein
MTRFAWTIAGTILLGIGIAGVILPLLPGTVFLLGASACYVRGSSRLHAWMHEHRMIGPHLRAIAAGQGMPMRAVVISLVMMWGAVVVSLLRMQSVYMQVLFVVLAVIGTYFIVREGRRHSAHLRST